MLPVVDDAPGLRVAGTGHGHLVDATGEEFQAIAVDPGPHAVATEPGGHGVEHFLVHEPAAAANGYAHFLEAAGKDPGQRAQQLALGIDLCPAPGVGPRKLLGEEAAVGRQALEVPRPSQSQGRFQRFLQMPVRADGGSARLGERPEHVAVARLLAPRPQGGVQRVLESARRAFPEAFKVQIQSLDIFREKVLRASCRVVRYTRRMKFHIARSVASHQAILLQRLKKSALQDA